jgi:hypothetical protein
MTYGSLQRATKRLKLHSYRLQVCHELKEIDKEKKDGLLPMVPTICMK